MTLGRRRPVSTENKLPFYWPMCCGQEMEFDPALWEEEGKVEYDCLICHKSKRCPEQDKKYE